jgi:hypothetical protein
MFEFNGQQNPIKNRLGRLLLVALPAKKLRRSCLLRSCLLHSCRPVSSPFDCRRGCLRPVAVPVERFPCSGLFHSRRPVLSPSESRGEMWRLAKRILRAQCFLPDDGLRQVLFLWTYFSSPVACEPFCQYDETEHVPAHRTGYP